MRASSGVVAPSAKLATSARRAMETTTGTASSGSDQPVTGRRATAATGAGFVSGADAGAGAALTADGAARRTFRVVKLRGGYERQAVDAFMTRIVATLRAHEAGTWRRGGPDGLLTSADVLNIKFQATAFRSGYEQDEIDEFLDDVAQALAAYEVRN